jgi:hypothetical protein
MRPVLPAAVLLLVACAETPDSTCTVPDGLAEGSGSVTLDGAEVDLAGAWMFTGTSVQINLTTPDGARGTLRLLADEAGTDASVALEGALPVSFALGAAERGAALWYATANGASASAGPDAPGSLTVTAYDGTVLDACFAFEARTTDGTSLALDEGAVRATGSGG